MLFAVLLLRLAVYLFKKNVTQSGSAGRVSEEGGRKLFGFINVRGQKGPLHNKLRLETGLTFLSVVALSNLKGVEKNGNCPDN